MTFTAPSSVRARIAEYENTCYASLCKHVESRLHTLKADRVEVTLADEYPSAVIERVLAELNAQGWEALRYLGTQTDSCDKLVIALPAVDP